MKKLNKAYLTVILFIITVSMTFTGCAMPYNVSKTESSPLKEAQQLINTFYYPSVPKDVLNKTAIKDMVSSLNDPYSEYFTKEEYDKFTNSINNVSYGLGVYIEKHDEGIKVIQVMDNSGAKEAGLLAGDIIVEASGKSLKGLSTEEASHVTKGENNTKVKIKVNRNGKILEFEIVRKPIYGDTVRGGIINDSIGYILIASFGEKTSEELKKNIMELEKKNPTSYIIDIRYNGGGYLESALEIGGFFIGDKNIMSMEDKSHKKEYLKAKPQNVMIKKPMILLTNNYSASASEVLSAALKDYETAFLVGAKTYGKGVSQTMFPLSDGSILKLTVKEFMSPSGNKINKIGITPNLEIDEKTYDPLQISSILFSGLGKTKTIKVTINNKSFLIDPKFAKTAPDAFKCILSKSDDVVEIVTNNNSQKTTKDKINLAELAS